ncbi:aspartate/tyrosine/aromatic aminotransferase [Aquincola sp. S2]|uniref:Aspartate/tyrosine/aromatic aminotransferase n=1 Tax=Pseudaquabacterium terrae TaxID=2732868 RepID=A0ABX2ELJ8_9BURK|nr:amino acid aminotransferase [Aquabacterium terrae]NRF69527.1 aspartate/tyrosine/aromatic aminotransferase [Aquabacterium terrae]
MFQHITPYAGDPIFALVDAFNADPRPQKVNLSIGIYFDEAGKLPVLDSVRHAEAQIVAADGPKPYLAMEGDAETRKQVQMLLLGADHPAIAAGRVATIQSVGSSGGLKVGADFMKTWLPEAQVWVSDPTWDNHRSMFEGSGFQVNTYPYYDASTGGVRFDAMLDTLRTLPARSIVLLHACCHNPTGVDLTRAQWDALIPVLRERELLPYLDLAYQGFGDGIDEDAYAVRALADSGITFFIANSFSKSMSVYGERCGALSAVCADAAEAALVLGQLRYTVRRIYSSPPMHSARIVSRVLGDAELRAQWEGELAAMRERIAAMRRALHDRLIALLPGRDFGYFLSQRGMFSYTGLSAAQVDRLREEHAVYLIRSGRICVAGLNTSNVERTAQAMAAVIGSGG